MKKTFKKRAFISAIAMLIVSAIVLTSATYAWFTMAKKVEVESMELNVTSPEGIQISANTSAFTTKLTVDEITGAATTRYSAYEGNTNNIPETIKPASTNLTRTGRNLNWYEITPNDDGKRMMISKMTNEKGSGLVAFDLFIKVKEAQTVKFGSTTVTCADNAEVLTAMRVAVATCGTVKEKAEAADFQSNSIESVTNYEIDATNHTQAVKDKVAAGISIPAMKAVRADSAGSWIYADTNFNNIITNTIYTGNVSSVTDADDATFSVAAGITLVRVYMWMEGNDVDCANDVAGSTINFNLVLEID